MTVVFSIEVDASRLDARLLRLRQGITAKTPLELIGQRMLAWFNENFRAAGAEQPWRPLAPSTIAGRRKGGGGAQALRDTGRLAQSFVYEVGENEVWAGTRDQRAPFHHFGTRPYEIRARTKKVMVFQTPEGPVFRRKVQHPGITARPLLPTKALAEQLAQRVMDRYTEELARGAG